MYPLRFYDRALEGLSRRELLKIAWWLGTSAVAVPFTTSRLLAKPVFKDYPFSLGNWGQIKGDIDYQKIARDVFLATDAATLMREVGLTPPTTTSKGFSVMKKPFDPSKPEAYIQSFAIRRT